MFQKQTACEISASKEPLPIGFYYLYIGITLSDYKVPQIGDKYKMERFIKINGFVRAKHRNLYSVQKNS